MDITRMEEDLIRDEAIRLRTYRCSAGHLTIGVGHKITPQDRIDEGDTISLEAAGLFLSRDIATALGTANTVFGRGRFESMTDARQRAITNMIFNLGAERFAKFVKMITAIKSHRWDDAARECLDSHYAKQVGRRAKRVAQALRSGQD
jgi:lysozyme